MNGGCVDRAESWGQAAMLGLIGMESQLEPGLVMLYKEK